jgi:hypothetical protein
MSCERVSVTLEVTGEHFDVGTRRALANRSHRAAIAAAPPSGRSSRATQVITACASFRRTTASATRAGSVGSSANGLRVSIKAETAGPCTAFPFTMNVAVPADQHSKMLGHPASSQTVTSRRSSVSVRSDWYSSIPCALRCATTRACACEWHAGVGVDAGLSQSAQEWTLALSDLRDSDRRAPHSPPPRRRSSSSPSRSSTSSELTLRPSERQRCHGLIGDATGIDLRETLNDRSRR